MNQTERLEHLINELRRVGVDPDTLSAGLGVREEHALSALAALPDGAGPAAFLQKLREMRASPPLGTSVPPDE
jgi:hypothetical protein